MLPHLLFLGALASLRSHRQLGLTSLFSPALFSPAVKLFDCYREVAELL